MAQIILTINDAIIDRVITAFSSAHGYQDTILTSPEIGPEPNRETRRAFSERILRDFVRQTVRAYEAKQAAEAAEDTKLDQNESEIIIT